jgi:2-polyprenyl-3-methyl-5-hydroxy-6-metoxy-1,4-benzoquinol methylase
MEFNPTGEIYQSKNYAIRWLAARLLSKVGQLLAEMQAENFLGLDVGCAEGFMVARLRRMGHIGRIVSTDIDMKKLTEARQINPTGIFCRSDAANLNFKADSFDYIIATEVLEHLPSPQRALNEIARIAKPGAAVILSVPYEPFFHWGNLIRGRHLKRGGYTPSHLHFWKRRDFRRFVGRFIEVEKEFVLTTFPWIVTQGRPIKEVQA